MDTISIKTHGKYSLQKPIGVIIQKFYSKSYLQNNLWQILSIKYFKVIKLIIY